MEGRHGPMSVYFIPVIILVRKYVYFYTNIRIHLNLTISERRISQYEPCSTRVRIWYIKIWYLTNIQVVSYDQNYVHDSE